MASEGRKVGSLKRRVRSHLARWEMKTCTPLWREAQFEVKMYKTPHVRSTFGSWDVEKKCTPLWREARFQVKMCKTPHDHVWTAFGSWDVGKVHAAEAHAAEAHAAKAHAAEAHAAVARSTFRSQSVQSTPRSEHFWRLICSKSVRRCGAKHISKSKCTKHTTFRPLLDVYVATTTTTATATTTTTTTLHCTTTTSTTTSTATTLLHCATLH